MRLNFIKSIKRRLPKLNKRAKIILLGLLACCLLITVVQLAYPRSHAPLKAKLFGQSIGFKKINDLAPKVSESFDNATTKLQVPGAEKTLSLKNLGASIDTKKTLETINYPLWQRFIPLSLFFASPKVNYYVLDFMTDEQKEVISKLEADLNTQPKDSKLKIENGQIVIEKGYDGSIIKTDDIVQQIAGTQFHDGETVIDLKTESIKAVVSEEELKQAYEKALAYSKHQVTIVGLDDKKHIIPTEALINLLTVVNATSEESETETESKTDITIDQKELEKYMQTTGSVYRIEPGTTVIKVTDGTETSRTTGNIGKSLNIATLKNNIQQALDSSELNNTITTDTINLAPINKYERSYSKTQKGLQTYLDDLGQSEDIRVAVKQLDGNGWSVGTRQYESVVAASTYKIYLAVYLYNKINNGEIKLSDPILGQTTDSCLEKMIVVSNNDCPNEWLDNIIGRKNVNNYLYGLGMSRATNLNNPSASQTSAQDLVNILVGINNSSLLGGNGRNSLLEKMSRQVYRDGLPAGTSGWVQNKPGFLWSYNHDAGIVHTSHGSYAIAILTKNSNFKRIAEITKQIESLMY